MNSSVGIKSLAIALPDQVLDNQFWIDNHPELFENFNIWAWGKSDIQKNENQAFNTEMAQYVEDPFRGAKRRHYLNDDESVLSLELKAAQEAITQAKLTTDDIDLLICTSFLSDQTEMGGAAHLASALELQHSAWNMESACSSFLVGYRTATGLVQSGQYKNVLVVTSCCYSKNVDINTTIAFGVGDAATAVVVSAVNEGEGYLGGCNRHSAETIGAVSFESTTSPLTGKMKTFLRPNEKIAKEKLRATSEPLLKHCVEGALADAEMQLEDIDYFIFNSPIAWYSDFCATALNIDQSKTHNIYPYYANVGAALPALSLYHAVYEGKIKPGDNVLVYTVGSVSSCTAVVIRWGETGLGRLPHSAPMKIESIA
ncbi:3-oxoacyl-ACP synthase III family protein [Algicola sagamiensis]|uniref:3-oxoacyl-ACP synthase III family protein n=1 Tax=Algicola sagamiensis TaxID=163869 RepID=UPI00037C4809|nr:3-oxoacyl-[acyl-carrier-protein] synthase III C-terminal domain-containing protein [Algicola sagamiensis]